MALKEALQRGSIQSSPYQKQGNVKNSDQLHMFSENQKAYFVVKRSLDIVPVSYTHLDVYKRQALDSPK